MSLLTEPYLAQVARWPQTGRHILAQFDNTAVVVYQAYRPTIGHFAASHGHFGGEFSLSRMSWIKPNFLWMMYRSGWGTKEDQEVILAVWLKRSAFDAILEQAVHSRFVLGVYANETEWKHTVERSSVRLQWDPDHDPSGTKVQRRAIQLGLRGDVLAHYVRNWIIDIKDISEFVREQYQHIQSDGYAHLVVPREIVYPITDIKLAARLGISTTEASHREAPTV